MFIQTEETPNRSTLKFMPVGTTVIGVVNLKLRYGVKLKASPGKDLRQHGGRGLQRQHEGLALLQQRRGRGLQLQQGDHGTGMYSWVQKEHKVMDSYGTKSLISPLFQGTISRYRTHLKANLLISKFQTFCKVESYKMGQFRNK